MHNYYGLRTFFFHLSFLDYNPRISNIPRHRPFVSVRISRFRMVKTFYDLIDKMSTYLWLPENGTSRMHTISKHVYGTVVYHIMFSNRNVNKKSMLYIRQTKHEVHCQHIYIYLLLHPLSLPCYEIPRTTTYKTHFTKLNSYLLILFFCTRLCKAHVHIIYNILYLLRLFNIIGTVPIFRKFLFFNLFVDIM
jgi:hypothetical protein